MSKRKAVKNKPIRENNKHQHKETSQPLPDETTNIFSTGARWIFLGLITLFVIVIRIRLLDIPLERDEGEYAYMGQLLLQGVPPYSEAYNMKLPGTSLMYAGIMAFLGQSIQGIHLGLMILNCSTIVLLFFLSKKLINDFTGIIASGAYAVLSLSSSVLGFAAHATHFVVLPAIGGALLLLLALEKNNPLLFFLSGVTLGLSFIMKQPGIFFSLFVASYILYHYWSSRPRQPLKVFASNLGLFLLGALLPLFIVVIWLYTAGVFDKFWFWTVQYASKYATLIPASEALANIKEQFPRVMDGFFLVWAISALGFAHICFYRNPFTKMFIILFAVFSFLSICPGLYFRNHYFITLLPVVSLLVGVSANHLHAKIPHLFKTPHAKVITLFLFIVAFLIGIVSQKQYFFKHAPLEIARERYGLNPFPESIEIAKFIETRSDKTDKIAVLGSEPQIYFYSKRRSATGHIYTYGLMEEHSYSLTMQKEMAHDIESSNPKFIIFVLIPTSWFVRPGSEDFIFSWYDNYIQRSYALVGVADIVSSGQTVYKWYDDAKTYAVQSTDSILIYERK